MPLNVDAGVGPALLTETGITMLNEQFLGAAGTNSPQDAEMGTETLLVCPG